MPRGDGTGPFGQGPGTERGMGREGTALGWVPVGVAFVPVAEQEFLIR